MSEVILSGTATDAGSTSTLIQMRVNNPKLVAIAVLIHLPGKPFRGTYDPKALTANLFFAQDEFTALASDLANGASIAISLTYESTDNTVKRFCFPSMCLPARQLQTVSRETLIPDSGVTAAATGTE